jgi:hypothetical protein
MEGASERAKKLLTSRRGRRETGLSLFFHVTGRPPLRSPFLKVLPPPIRSTNWGLSTHGPLGNIPDPNYSNKSHLIPEGFPLSPHGRGSPILSHISMSRGGGVSSRL